MGEVEGGVRRTLERRPAGRPPQAVPQQMPRGGRWWGGWRVYVVVSHLMLTAVVLQCARVGSLVEIEAAQRGSG